MQNDMKLMCSDSDTDQIPEAFKSKFGQNVDIQNYDNYSDQNIILNNNSNIFTKIKNRLKKFSNWMQDVDNYILDGSIYSNKDWNRESTLCQLHQKVIRATICLKKEKMSFFDNFLLFL